MKQTKKGFTLIELLVVIAIIAVLSVVVILTLNPAELLRQARDSNRISDLNTLKSAISLFLADVSTSSAALGVGSRCYTTVATGTCISWFPSQLSTSTSVVQLVDGTGWIPVRFTAISAGAPIGNLPLDPTNVDPYFYSYIASSSFLFELAANMESSKYASGGSSPVESQDGGNNDDMYEVGSSVRL